MNNRQAADIAITAAEGGTGYWAQIDNTIRPYPFPEQDEYPDDFVFYTFNYDDIFQMDIESSTDITPKLIKEGYRIATEKGHRWSSVDVYTDPEYADADDADVIVQYGVFGEVVFA